VDIKGYWGVVIIVGVVIVLVVVVVVIIVIVAEVVVIVVRCGIPVVLIKVMGDSNSSEWGGGSRQKY